MATSMGMGAGMGMGIGMGTCWYMGAGMILAILDAWCEVHILDKYLIFLLFTCSCN